MLADALLLGKEGCALQKELRDVERHQPRHDSRANRRNELTRLECAAKDVSVESRRLTPRAILGVYHANLRTVKKRRDATCSYRREAPARQVASGGRELN